MFGLKQLGPASRDEAYAFCAEQPERCTYIAGWLSEGGLERSPRVPRAWLFAETSKGRIAGLIYISSTGVVLPVAGRRGLDALVEMTRANRSVVRVLVGERSTVAGLWAQLEALGLEARIARDQVAYAVDRDRFAPGGERLELTVAGHAHVDEVVAASAAMSREEAQDDPQGRNPELFRTRIRERIERGRDFIYLEGGRVVFKTNVAALSSLGGQIEGVYTTPTHRGRQIGRRGIAAVTAWVLERAERAVLLVNEDNALARRLYEEQSYRPVLESRTIFVG